jgi:hypothetical protein
MAPEQKAKLFDQTMRHLVVEKVTDEKLNKIKEYHQKLSQVYGIHIGLAKKD